MRCHTDSFICELLLRLSGNDERVLRIRFDTARQCYNACLSESLRRLDLLRQSQAYQDARSLPTGKRGSEAWKARAAAFRLVDEQAGFREYDLHAWAAEHIAHEWLGEHLDSSTVQKIATRAFRAVREYAVGKKGRPRFKGPNQLDSVEGKTNGSGIRWRNGAVEWRGLRLRAVIDPGDPVIAHGLQNPVKYVRLVRRRLNGKTRYWAQLICAGRPYQKPENTVGAGRVGIDPGPRKFGLAGADWGAQVDLATPLKSSRAEIRRLQRHVDRQRRANNPRNYLSDGRIRPGPKRWQVSHKQRPAQRKLAETQRRASAHRRGLHGQLANDLLRLGDDIRIERNSYRSFQRHYGRSVGLAGPAGFVATLTRKAANAGAQVRQLPAWLRLSQVCHGCGGVERKPLAQRVHTCACGVGPVQRDVYSAWLACMAVPDPEGPTDPQGSAEWRLDADQARRAWSGAEPRLPAASSPLSVPEFSAWAREVARGGPRAARLPPERSRRVRGTERLAGKVGAMADEARNVVGVDHVRTRLDVADGRESGRVVRVATRTPSL
jgi:transposase